MIKDIVTRVPVADLLAVRFGLASIALAVLAGPRLRLTRRLLAQGGPLGLLYGVAQILRAAGFAVGLGGESLTARMIIGGLAILSAMYLVEQPERRRIKDPEYVG